MSETKNNPAELEELTSQPEELSTSAGDDVSGGGAIWSDATGHFDGVVAKPGKKPILGTSAASRTTGRKP